MSSKLPIGVPTKNSLPVRSVTVKGYAGERPEKQAASHC